MIIPPYPALLVLDASLAMALGAVRQCLLLGADRGDVADRLAATVNEAIRILEIKP